MRRLILLLGWLLLANGFVLADDESDTALVFDHGAIIAVAAWNDDETHLLTAGDDGRIVLWDAATGDAIQTMIDAGAVMGAVWDGRDAILSWTDGGTVTLWDVAIGQPARRLEAAGMVRGALLLADSGIIAWGDSGDVLRWDADDAEIFRLTHESAVFDVQFGVADAELLVFEERGIVHLYDAATGQRLRAMDFSADTLGVDWDAGGARLLSWGRQGAATIWNIGDGGRLAVRSLSHSRTFVNGAAWTTGFDQVISWGADETARLWDAATGELLFSGLHRDWVTGATLDRAGERLLTWSFTDLTLWDVATGEAIARFMHRNLVSGAALNADESAVLSWSWDGTARIWPLADG